MFCYPPHKMVSPTSIFVVFLDNAVEAYLKSWQFVLKHPRHSVCRKGTFVSLRNSTRHILPISYMMLIYLLICLLKKACFIYINISKMHVIQTQTVYQSRLRENH